MVVKYAAQLLSKSTADAIDYCRDVLKYDEFIGSEATSNFIRNINDVFDIQNSSNKGEKRKLKGPYNPTNLETITRLTTYLKSLKDSKGKRIIDGLRKTGFLGKF